MTTQTNSPRPQGVGVTNGSSSDPQGNAQEAAGQATQAAGQAQEKAQALGHQAQDKVREALAGRSSDLAGQLNEQASGLRSASAVLREQGNAGPAKAADRLAVFAEKIGAYLSEKDPDAMLHDAENLGRRKPAAFAAGGLALGFAASRFLKASSGRRHSAQSSGQFTSRPSGPAGQPPANDRAQDTQVTGIVPPTPGFAQAVPPVADPYAPVAGAVPPVDRGI